MSQSDIDDDVTAWYERIFKHLDRHAQQEPPTSEAQSDTDTEPANFNVDNPSDMTELLVEIRNDVKRMNNKFDKLDKKVQEIKKDNKYLKQQNASLSQQVRELTTTVINLETRMNETEKRNEQLEAQSRRENLKFYGLTDDKAETWEQSGEKFDHIYPLSYILRNAASR